MLNLEGIAIKSMMWVLKQVRMVSWHRALRNRSQTKQCHNHLRGWRSMHNQGRRVVCGHHLYVQSKSPSNRDGTNSLLLGVGLRRRINLQISRLDGQVRQQHHNCTPLKPQFQTNITTPAGSVAPIPRSIIYFYDSIKGYTTWEFPVYAGWYAVAAIAKCMAQHAG